MSIKPIEMAMIQNTHAPAQQAQADDTKGAVMINQGAVAMEKEVEAASQQVQQKADADGGEFSFSGGNGSGYAPGGKSAKTKQPERKPDGVVRVKGKPSGFNITI